MNTARLRSLLANLALSAGTVIVFCAAAEALGRFLEQRRPTQPVAGYIWDWQRDWQGDFYTLKPDGVGWPPGQEINGDGMRDRPHPVPRLAGRHRLVVLGDSVTAGADLAFAEAFPQQLQSLWTERRAPVEVLTFALFGWSTRQERIAYQRLARKYRPDQVLLAVCLNDIPELHNNLTRPPRIVSFLHQRSALVRQLVDAQGREVKSVEDLFHDASARRVQTAMRAFFAEVAGLRDEAAADGARLSVLVFPFRFQLAASAPPPTVQEAIREFCARERIPFLDVLPALRPAGSGAFIDYDHLSPQGATLVAEALNGWLDVAAPEATERNAGDLLARVAAVEALGRAADRDPGATRALFRSLQDPSEHVRWRAAKALEGVDATWVAELAQAADSADPYVRGFATWSLGRLGAAEAAPTLLAHLDDDNAYDKDGAMLALAAMGPTARQLVPRLTRDLTGSNVNRRWKAARALASFGRWAQASAPELIAATASDDPELQIHAIRALLAIGADRAAIVPALEKARSNRHGRVRREATRALVELR